LSDPVKASERVLSLRPDRRLPDDVWSGSPKSIVRRIKEHYSELAARTEPAVEELRAIFRTHESVELLSSIAIPSGMRIGPRRSSVDDAEATHTWPAKIEYLVGLALSMPRGSGSVPNEVTERAIALLGDVFDGIRAKLLIDSLSGSSSADSPLDEVLFLLRLEYLLDRMPGYAVHVERIDAEVFDRHRSYYVESLGFNPGDVARIVRRRVAVLGERASRSMRKARVAMRSNDTQAATRIAACVKVLTDTRTWDPEAVAADVNANADEVNEMLKFFSTTFDSQPDFRLPGDENAARTRPCIDLQDGTYFVADPWSLLGAVHPRLARAAAEDPTGPLQRYRRHREDALQRLVTASLGTSFGTDRVFERQHYSSHADGPGEIDVLVALETPIIVEAKAHGLTEPGRRGAPARVATVAANVIDTALGQLRRAHNYIFEEGGRSFSATEGGTLVRRLGPNLIGAGHVIVTFERMDPLAMSGVSMFEASATVPWVVSIADLLMVTDLLRTSVELHHYIVTRALMAASGPAVYVESDALGRYLVDRLASDIAKASEQPGNWSILGYGGRAINNYFTSIETGFNTDRPPTGVPPEILDSLCSLADTSTGLWTSAVGEVMSTDAAAWRRWKSFTRRHQSTRDFRLSDRMSLLCAADAALSRSGDGTLCLALPTPRETRLSTSTASLRSNVPN
jgi:Fe2+ transport system protein FeoA